MKTTTLVLALGLLLAAPADQEVRYGPEAGTKLSREIVRRYDLSLESLSVEVDGQPMEVTADIEIEDELRVSVIDELVSTSGGRPTKLLRSYEKLDGDQSQKSGGEEMQRERKSALQGKKVAFTWDEEDEEYALAYAEGESEKGLLDGLAEDLDLRAFLPEGSVSEGESWEVDPKHFAIVIRPGGDLKWKANEGRDPGLEMGAQFAANLEGKLRATWRGTRKVDEVELGVIEIESEVETKGEDEENGQVVTLEFELEGELLWNLARGHLASCALAGDLAVTLALTRDIDQGGHQFQLVQTTRLAGKASFKLEVD